MIHFKDVSYIREHQQTILNKINWQVNTGENWAILGLNGAGKTTLLQLITGYIWPSSGTLRVLDETFGQTSLPNLRKRIGWVSSAMALQLKDYDLSEVIVLSGKFATIGLHQKVSQEEIAAAKDILTQCGGADLIGKKYGLLSQGQRQLVLIARALMAAPEILILDEPCNGLDLFAREELLARIEKLSQSKTAPNLIFVTHYTEEILPCFNHLLLLKDGQIFKQGQRETLLTATELSEFYAAPIQIVPHREGRLLVLPQKQR